MGRVVKYDQPQHVVYVFFGADGQALYVGSTFRIESRMAQHARHKPWQEVARIELYHFTSRVGARRFEADMIASLNPSWNELGT